MSWSGVLGTIVGGVLLAVVLLTEPQERGIQSWIEGLWIRLDDAADIATSKHLQLMHNVGAVVNAILDSLMGRRLLSLRGMVVSSMFGFALLLCALSLVFFLVDYSDITREVSRFTSAEQQNAMLVLASITWLAGFCLLVFSLLPAMLKPRAVPAWTVLAIIFWAFALGPCTSSDLAEGAIAPYLTSLCIGAGLNLVLVSVIRIVFRRVVNTTSLARALSLVIGTTMLVSVSYALPFALFLATGNSQRLLVLLLVGVLSNTAVLVIALLPLFVVVAYLAHKTMWPIMNSIVYAIQRRHLISDQKSGIVYVGAVCVMRGTLGDPGWLADMATPTRVVTYCLGLGVAVLIGSIAGRKNDRDNLIVLKSSGDAESSARILTKILDRFLINTDDMSPSDRKELAIAQLEARRSRLLIWTGGSMIAVVVAAAILVVAIVGAR